jgi:integrase
MTTIKNSVTAIFNRRNALKKDGTGTIEIQVYQSSPKIRKYISTGISVEPKFWNKDKAIVTPSHPQNLHINKVIKEITGKIEDFFYKTNIKGANVTESSLNEFIEGSNGTDTTFTEFYKNEIDHNSKRGTRKEHIYTFNLLSEFKASISFDEINYSFVQDFDKFLRNKKNLSQNTIYKHHSHINRFFRLAYLKGIFEGRNPYENFKTKKEKSDRINLSLEEVKKIEELDFSTNFKELELIKDMFLFSCYTGLRFSDIMTLEPIHLVETSEGLTIIKKMEKVPKPITLPLALLFEGKPLRLIQKYKNNYPIFPSYSNQHVNRELKTIASVAKISMRLTFHIARHTFGSALADITHNPYLIMDLMGHSDIKTSMIYIHRSQERINKQLRGLKWE